MTWGAAYDVQACTMVPRVPWCPERPERPEIECIDRQTVEHNVCHTAGPHRCIVAVLFHDGTCASGIPSEWWFHIVWVHMCSCIVGALTQRGGPPAKRVVQEERVVQTTESRVVLNPGHVPVSLSFFHCGMVWSHRCSCSFKTPFQVHVCLRKVEGAMD